MRRGAGQGDAAAMTGSREKPQGERRQGHASADLQSMQSMRAAGRAASRAWRYIIDIFIPGRFLLGAVVLACVVSWAFDRSGFLQRLELDAFDALLRSIPDAGTDPRILVIAIRESDTSRLGYPVSDAALARAMAVLQDGGARVIGVDLYRHIAHPPGTDLLAEQFAAGNVVGIRFVGSDRDKGQVPAPLALPATRTSFSDLVIDPDGILRRALLYVGGDPAHYSLALRSVLTGYPRAQESFSVTDHALGLGEGALPRLRSFSGGYADVDNGGYQTLLRYRSRRAPARVVTLGNLLDGRVASDQISGRIVLIGMADAGVADEFYTPYSAGLVDSDFAMLPVLVHAQIVSQLLDILDGTGAQYRFLTRPGEVAWLALWAALTAAIIWWLPLPLALLCAVPMIPLAIAAIGRASLAALWWPPIVAPGLAALLAAGLVSVGKYLHRSSHDAITGLPGRRVFLEKFRARLPQDRGIAIALIGIDRLQTVNKAMGHTGGDQLLRAVSARLQRWLGGSTDLAHIAGDEFAILFFGLDAEDIEARIRAMRRMLAEPLQLGSRTLSVGTSVGVAFADPASTCDPETVLRHAHTAMYRAKAHKQAPLEVFSSDMEGQASDRLDLESELLGAMKGREFFLVYQPVIDLRTGVLFGFEALLRWQSPRRGLVGPDHFITILEETGMIVPLGQWVLETACQQIAQWRAESGCEGLTMNVNLSGRQIEEPGLEESVVQALAGSGLPGSALQLEFTESMLMRDVEATHRLMRGLQSLGVGLAIDDFGTGYSSLSYLHRFPTDTLKIDRAFVENITDCDEDRNIVDTIIALGQRLDMALVAEGIETREQADALHRAGCHCAQGYFFSRPLSATEATAIVRGHDPPPQG